MPYLNLNITKDPMTIVLSYKYKTKNILVKHVYVQLRSMLYTSTTVNVLKF